MLDPTHLKYENHFGADPVRFMRSVMAFRTSHTDGEGIKFKARLCPNGSSQVKGIDYDQSYSPTARHQLILMCLHIFAVLDFDAFQFDVAAAYLEVGATEDQYMRMSDDLIALGFAKTRFVRLLVNFYGRPNAGRVWFVYFVHILLEFNLEQAKEEPCLFTLSEGEGALRKILIVLLFVDDGLYGGNHPEKLREFEEFLRNKIRKLVFKELTKFVGLSVRRDRDQRKIYVSTPDTVSDLLTKYPVGGATTVVDTPIPTTLEYLGMKGEEPPIWNQVGSLSFIAGRDWPDLLVPVALLAGGGATPHINHVKGVKRALRYVAGHAVGRVLVLGGCEPVKLVGNSDASYEPGHDSRFRYGFNLALGVHSGSYTVISKRSKTVSHSSLQSEMRALCDAAKEISADRDLLTLLGCPQNGPTLLHTDSLCAIDLVNNQFGYHPKCRHFNRDTNYVRECVLAGILELIKIDTKDNPSDLTTKLLCGDLVEKHTGVCLRGFPSP